MTRETKFTPGPWKVNISTKSNVFPKRAIFSRDNKFPLAGIFGDPRPKKENEANAHLIAAAPDMYEALKKSENFLMELYKIKEDAACVEFTGGSFVGNQASAEANIIWMQIENLREILKIARGEK